MFITKHENCVQIPIYLVDQVDLEGPLQNCTAVNKNATILVYSN